MSDKVRDNQAQFLNALFQTAGNIVDAEKLCKISRHSHYKWIREDPDYKQRHRETMCEVASIAFDSGMKLIKGMKTTTVETKEKYDKNGKLVGKEITTIITEHKPENTMVKYVLNKFGDLLGLTQEIEAEEVEQNLIQITEERADDKTE